MEVEDNICSTKNTSDLCETDCDSYSGVSKNSHIRPILLNKTQNMHDFCETGSNSYLKDCRFLGFCNLCKDESVTSTKYKYFSEFINGANTSMKEEVVEDDNVIMTSESPVFIKLQPIREEKYPDSYEKYEIKSGIFDLSASLDSDYENYTESSDGVSDNSDEEIDDTKTDIIVHKPLKGYTNKLVGSLTSELFSKPVKAQEKNYVAKPVLICSTPGIGYLNVTELIEKTLIEKLVIEDPVDHKLRHQFLNNGHASCWLDKFFKKKMTFEFRVRLKWILLISSINRKAYHFNPEILKDKSLIVTESGVQKLSINDAKELSRFHYRRKMENNATKLACFIPPVVNVCMVPLPFLLHEATEEIGKQKKTHLNLQYELQMQSLEHKRLKRKLRNFRRYDTEERNHAMVIAVGGRVNSSTQCGTKTCVLMVVWCWES